MNLATESADSRRDAFAVAAARRGLLPLVVEKDFWVCWTLERLFSLPEFGGHLLFKGGTSLSKAYGLIRRFSEDIDLSLSRAAFGVNSGIDLADGPGGGLADPEAATSNTQRRRRAEALVAAFRRAVTDRLLPALRAEITSHLGEEGWSLTQDGADPGTLHFAYPRTSEGEPSYMRPEVKIELGGRSDDWPAEVRTVTAYVAEELPQVTPGAVPVRVLAARRTFWEKATILHAEYHRPADRATGERLSRHYSDLARLAGTGVEAQALADLPLLARVREHKAALYTSPWASYGAAAPGTLRLSPRPERLAALRADYRGMGAMFFEPPPPFEAVLAQIAALEARVNASTR